MVSKHLTYANVVATLALLIAVGGASAFAATQLGKNSVGPKQLRKNAVTTKKIKKNAVVTAKIKDGAVTTGKLANDAVTGDKVDEAKLGKVPTAVKADNAITAEHAATAATAQSAASLNGFSTTELTKAQSVSSAFFISTLSLKVTGFGTFQLVCDIKGAAIDDDTVTFGYNVSAPAGAISGGFNSSSGFPLDTPVTYVQADNSPNGSGIFTNENDRVFYSYSISVPSTGKSVQIQASGFDNDSNAGCAGQIHALAFN